MGKGNTRVAALCAAMEAIAPLARAAAWDNVGLLAGDTAARVSRVLLCIDLMPEVVSEAIRFKADAVIAYHPPIFRPITRLVGPSDAMEAQVLRCVSRGIAVYSPHTALDAAQHGTNAVLATACDMLDPRPLEPTDDPEVGMGRIGEVAPIALAALVKKLKRRTGARCVATVGDADRVVRRAIVGVGAAGAMPFAVALRADDVIVTGEIRHHDALRIRRVGCAAIALSHWSSERPALAALAGQLGERLPGVTLRLSEADCEPFVRA